MPKTKLSPAAIKLIDGKNFGNVALVMGNGSPHVSPVWVDRDGDVILLNTAEGRVKAKYLKPNSKIALSIFNQNNPYENVVITGRVLESTKKGAREHIDKMAKKYWGVDKYTKPDLDRILIRIEPDRITEDMG